MHILVKTQSVKRNCLSADQANKLRIQVSLGKHTDTGRRKTKRRCRTMKSKDNITGGRDLVLATVSTRTDLNKDIPFISND